MLGLGICDALGASTEFIPFDKKRSIIKKGFKDVHDLIQNGTLKYRSGKIGVWTNDCSMALCMADSLLLNNDFDPQHMRFLFILWFKHGLNNGGRGHSIELEGNIAISMKEFEKKQ